jgi:hypothetical protein
VTELARIERRYRRLLAWYPEEFRLEQGDELLGVLMAGARRDQRWPGLGESADLLRSAVVMRFRRMGSAADGKAWTDALALFSLVAPVVLLLATVLEVAVPYHLPSPSPRYPRQSPPWLSFREIGGLRVLTVPGFDISLGCMAVIAALVLLGMRRSALAAIAATTAYWIVAGRISMPFPLQALSVAVYLLAGAALIASPGPRRGRELINWRHGIVLLLAAAAVQAGNLMYDAASSIARQAYWAASPVTQVTHAGGGTSVRVSQVFTPDLTGYLVAGAALTAIAIGLAVAWKQGRYYLLLLGVMLYPFGLEVGLAPSWQNSGEDLMGLPTPGHLTALFLPSLLVAAAAILIAAVPRRSVRLQVPRT